MATDRQTVSIDGRLLRLTNPDKVLYPATGTTKAEVIRYYVTVAPALLPQLAGRPVTRKRWVEGVGSGDDEVPVFFEKNLPDSAPAWIRRVTLEHSSRRTVYPVFDSVADLAWAGQLTALELHVPQWRVDGLGVPLPPDRLVLDLDPGPGAGLAECAAAAKEARELLTDVGLEPIPVTSGSKGMHLYCAVDGDHDADYLNAFAKKLAMSLAEHRPDLIVASMAKDRRNGKVFVDWSQNNGSKTTICPYSLRGRERPWVAAPREWDELDDDLRQLDLDEVLDRLDRKPDPLASQGRRGSARLSRYRSMRDAGATPEPVPDADPEPRDPTAPVFVIQEHHARALHWDFRLERDGVLVSWALPKGVPDDPSRNHLAVPTEDHPIEYATFSGTIPAGEYGAGEVTIWDRGTYETRKWRDGEIIVTLHGGSDGGLGAVRRTFALIRTEKNWLIHLMANDDPTKPASDESSSSPVGFIAPMLATPSERTPRGDDWVFEMKWDGVRAVIAAQGGRARVFSRIGRDVTASYPEVAEALAQALPDGSVVDGEIVALDDGARPDFGLLQSRMSEHRPDAVRALTEHVPVTFIAFDLLIRGGESLLTRPYTERRAALEELGLDDETAVTPPAFAGSPDAAIQASRRWGLEGVVAKRRDSPYWPGERSAGWRKLKHRNSQSVIVGGWRPGASAGFGSLLVGVTADEGLRYVGRVGTGFSADHRRELAALLREREQVSPPFASVPDDVAADAHWVKPDVVGEVVYAGWTGGGLLRHASWRGRRKDLRPDDVHIETEE